GLSKVYGIIKQTGGFITVDSEPGAGTVFRIFLPRHQAEARPDEARPAEESGTRGAAQALASRDLSGSATVLLVEDEDAVRLGGMRALYARGYTVHAASSGIEALEIYRELGGKVDLV